MRVSVFGIGYVGAVTAACLAERGHDVTAVDSDPVKISCINDGRSPVYEGGLDDLIRIQVQGRRLRALSNARQALRETDLSLICVGTPGKPDGSIDFTQIQSVCRDIAAALTDQNHTVVIRSTMLPGSAETVCLPVLENSGKKFGFAYHPEFLREVSAIADFYHPPKIVIGADNPETAELVLSLYDGIDAPRIVTNIKTAEAVKYADNAWHAVKVGFANEIGNIFKAAGVDSHKAMDIFCQDTKLNISGAYLKPGFAFGGSCLTKDVRALRAAAQKYALSTPLFDGLLKSNERQIEQAMDIIRRTGRRKPGLMGLSFKAGTDDLRESPLMALADRLVTEGFDLTVYDSLVSPSKLNALSSRLTSSPEELFGKADLLIVGNSAESYGDLIQKHANENIPVIDLVRLKDLENRSGYEGICW